MVLFLIHEWLLENLNGIITHDVVIVKSLKKGLWIHEFQSVKKSLVYCVFNSNFVLLKASNSERWSPFKRQSSQILINLLGPITITTKKIVPKIISWKKQFGI